MREIKRHYWLETWRETRCGIDAYANSVKTTDHWDRVTCKHCLKHRKPKVPKNGYFCDTAKVMTNKPRSKSVGVKNPYMGKLVGTAYGYNLNGVNSVSTKDYADTDTEIWFTGSTWLY